jgi:hypothetical protein
MREKDMRFNKRKDIIPIEILKKHYLLIFIVGSISFLGMWYFFKDTVQVYFESKGYLEIEPVVVPAYSKNSFEVSQNSITQYYDNYVGTQIEKFVSSICRKIFYTP